jgi:hypothetical protein
MARHPDVFVRDLSMDEGQKLVRITRTAKDSVKLRRAIVVLSSGQGQYFRWSSASRSWVRDAWHDVRHDDLRPQGRPA